MKNTKLKSTTAAPGSHQPIHACMNVNQFLSETSSAAAAITRKEMETEGEKSEAKKNTLLQSADLVGYLNRFGGHERQGVFFRIHSRLSDDQYWKTLRDVWSLEEVTFPHKRNWIRLFRSERPARELLMTSDECDRLATLPEKVCVFRGIGNCRHKNGLSWTLSVETARFFANYACGGRRSCFGFSGLLPVLVSGWCRKRDVLALFLDRKEDEIVIPAGLVCDKKLELVELVREPIDFIPAAA
jgi:hypothetical protein